MVETNQLPIMPGSQTCDLLVKLANIVPIVGFVSPIKL